MKKVYTVISFLIGIIFGIMIALLICEDDKSSLLDFFSTLASFATIAMVIVALYTHRNTIEREKKLETIKEYNIIRENYPNVCNAKEKIKSEYLNDMERFAVGVNEGIFDIRILKKMSGGRLIKQYDDCLKCFIDEKKCKSGNSDRLYFEYTKMIQSLKK